MMDIYVTLAIILILVAVWYQKRKNHMSLFRRLNIPGPEPHLITGNLKEYNEKGLAECQSEWTKKYGKILGYYLGSRPMLLVSDTNLLKSVLVKDFQDFVDRDIFIPDAGIPDQRVTQSIGMLPGYRWREIRSLLSSAFTTNKTKQMTYAVIHAVEILADIIKEKAKHNEEFDVIKLFRSLTMDIIGRTAFGIKTDVQNDSSDAFLQNMKRVTEQSASTRIIFWTLCFPELYPLLMFYRRVIDVLRGLFGLSSAWKLFKDFEKVIKARRIHKTVRPDLLQLMLEANISDEELKEITGKQLTANADNDEEITANESRKPSSNLRYMTNNEVMANAMVFMLAGYDTVATTLSFVFHLLANHPHIQDKLREEVRNVLEQQELDYSAVTKMKYMAQVISEALRLYPTVLTFTYRTVGKSYTYKNFELPKGLVIQPALWQMHRDPEVWENPEDFDPDSEVYKGSQKLVDFSVGDTNNTYLNGSFDCFINHTYFYLSSKPWRVSQVLRFSPERKPEINIYAYQPFGVGPRNCIGVRFSYTIMKLSLARILNSFRFVATERTEKGDPKLEFRLFQINPLHGVHIRAIRV